MGFGAIGQIVNELKDEAEPYRKMGFAELSF